MPVKVHRHCLWAQVCVQLLRLIFHLCQYRFFHLPAKFLHLCITELQTQKSVSALAPLKRNRMLEIAFVLVIIFFLGLFIHENSSTWYYVLSASALILFLMIDIYGCIRQIMTIQELHYSDSVINIQQKLVSLEASLLNYIRFAFLCIPFYLVYINGWIKIEVLLNKTLLVSIVYAIFFVDWREQKRIFSYLG